MSPKVSIALAAYRGERFLPAQLQSLLEQTRPPDEIIIGDDSPDAATGQTVAAAAAAAHHVKIDYQHNAKRIGIGRNFEQAVRRCSGDIIFLCDQDDVWHPEKIEHYLAVLASDAGCTGVFADSALVDETLRPDGGTLWEMRGFTPAIQRQFAVGDQLGVFLKRVYCSAHNIAFRAECKKFLLPFPELIGLYPDTWIGLALAMCGRWQALPEILTDYRIHTDNASAPGRRGFFAQLRASRRAIHHNFLHGNTLIAEALWRRRAFSGGTSTRQLAAYLDFCRVRETLRPEFRRRLPAIFRAWRNGDYQRFANGWKSLGVDLLLR